MRVEAPDLVGEAEVDEDAQHLASLGYSYESQFKREMSFWGNVSLGFTYLSPVVAIYSLFAASLSVAGPPMFWSLIIVGIGQLLVATVFGEVVAAYPVAGGVYPWSRRLWGRKWGWMNGWVYLVALLTTIAFFIAGQLAFGFLVDFTRQAILGGGPFESLIRLLTHDNQMSDLAPTAGVIIAKTLDSLVMPIMSMLVYVVPNFQALDVTNSVADGFAVSWNDMAANTLLALAYALPFSIVGYFILKNREVAA